MQHQYGEDDGVQFDLPPVQLPQIPVAPVRTLSQILVSVEDRFKEQSMQVDESSIESVQFLSGGTLLAVGCGSGCVKVVSPAQGNVQFILQGEDKSPVTSLAHNLAQSQIRHALMVTHSQGTIQYWHATSRQLLFSKKYPEMIQTCEISPDGSYYAVAGEAGRIWFGHLTKGDTVEVENGHLGKHQNRIFCLKWSDTDHNILASGGWDRAVHFWDVRLKTSVKQIFGSYIGGEAIDIKENKVLLGSNKPDLPLRVYDLKADKFHSINWPITSQQQIHYTTGVLSCAFGDKADIIACTPKNQVRLFREGKCISQYRREVRLEEGEQEAGPRLYCMQRDSHSGRVVTGWSDGSLHWLSY